MNLFSLRSSKFTSLQTLRGTKRQLNPPKSRLEDWLRTMPETKRSISSRFAQLKLTLRHLVSEQLTVIRPFVAQSSPFLQLPRELRDLIYCFLLGSTRVSFGRKGDSRMKPAPHSLAILRVCRQTQQETQSLWIEQILISFEDIYSLLEKLSSIPSTTFSQIRQIRTGGRVLFLVPGTVVHRREYYSHCWHFFFLNCLWAR